ncbi:hypothetical protein J6590_043307 [Homalodisca vitripennis]|nr:hypothetical protein J6590_043307 [Homalodisca vitripennis]
MSAICSVCDVLCDDSVEVIKCAGERGTVRPARRPRESQALALSQVRRSHNPHVVSS